MRKCMLVVVLFALLAGACGDKSSEPKGPFVPLVGRLPADADLVVLADLGALAKVWKEKVDELAALPVIKKNPEVEQLLAEQLGLLRSLGRMAKGKIGVNPFEDLTHMALGISLRSNEEVALVTVVSGTIPPDLFNKVRPDISPRKQGKVEVWPVDDEFEAAILEGQMLVLTSKAAMNKALEKPAIDKKLLEAHKGLFAKFEPGFLLRTSFVMPAWARAEARKLADRPGVNILVAMDWLGMDMGRELKLEALMATEQAASDVHYFFQAEAQMIKGSHHLMRGAGLIVMALDLDGLPEMPPPIARALANRDALNATLDALLPAAVSMPNVELDGKRVTMKAARKDLQGALLIMGTLSAVAVPAFFTYLERAQAAGAGQ